MGSTVVLIDERHLADFYDLAVTLAIRLKAKCRDLIFLYYIYYKCNIHVSTEMDEVNVNLYFYTQI